MAKHVVILRDKRKGTLTKDLLSQHVEHLKVLSADGRLILCGPFAEDDGAFLLLEGDSREEVERLVRRDPFVAQGYYAGFEVHTLLESGPHNNWLQDDDQTEGNLRREAPCSPRHPSLPPIRFGPRAGTPSTSLVLPCRLDSSRRWRWPRAPRTWSPAPG